jgi:hypothetical protein
MNGIYNTPIINRTRTRTHHHHRRQYQNLSPRVTLFPIHPIDSGAAHCGVPPSPPAICEGKPAAAYHSGRLYARQAACTPPPLTCQVELPSSQRSPTIKSNPQNSASLAKDAYHPPTCPIYPSLNPSTRWRRRRIVSWDFQNQLKHRQR